MKKHMGDDDYKEFIKCLGNTKKFRNSDSKEWFETQHKQIEDIIKLEKEFKELLFDDKDGPKIYKRFIFMILFEKRNILTARPYFRERQKRFSDFISNAIKSEDPNELAKYNINYQFVAFAMKHVDPELKAILSDTVKEIKRIRNEIFLLNLPLAINRARVFFSRTPTSHLTFMDLILIASAGLLHGIDKYTPDADGSINTKQFRSTVIGTMGGMFLEAYNQTILHFFPQDKRKLYRAHKAVGRYGPLLDNQEIADMVNAGKDTVSSDFIKNPTNADEIAYLMAAASTVSADSIAVKDAGGFDDLPELNTKFAAPEESRPDVLMEEKDNIVAMSKAIGQLTIFERKLIRLKGIRIDSV